MGQRLNIQIEKDKKPIANAYYHWSAYTGTALEMTREVLEKLKEVQNYNVDPLVIAYQLLSVTGAKLNEQEYLHISNLDRGPHFDLLKTTFDYLPLEVNRNDGLISFSDEGMKDTNYWAEGGVVINLDDGTFYFDVFHSEDTLDEIIDSYDLDEEDIDDIPVLHDEIDFDNMKLENIPQLERIFSRASSNQYGLAYLQTMGFYIGVIE